MHNSILLEFRTDLVPDIVKQVAKTKGISTTELMKRASESFEAFHNRGIEIMIELDQPGMQKEAMEKLAFMDKQAFALATLAAAAAIPFSLWSAYDLAKNTWGGAGDMLSGNFGKAFKRAPAMAFDTLGILPGVGVAGKGYKWLKAAKGGKSFKKGLSLLNQQRKLVEADKAAKGFAAAGKKLSEGKMAWLHPSSYFKSKAGRKALGAEFTRKSTPAYLKAQQEALSKGMVSNFGAGAGKMHETGGDLGYGAAFFLNKKKSADTINVLDRFHSDKWHKFYQHADPADALSMVRMAPMVPLLGGAVLGSEGLQNAGSKGLNFLNYYGDEQPAAGRSAMYAQARDAARAGGRMAGYYSR